jgi:hypothetical protein
MLEVPNRAGTFASVDSLRIGQAGKHMHGGQVAGGLTEQKQIQVMARLHNSG